MKTWQKVRRLTPRQKGEIIEKCGHSYDLGKDPKSGEYVLIRLEDRTRSDYPGLRRCPHCSYVDIWFLCSVPKVAIVCSECGKQGGR